MPTATRYAAGVQLNDLKVTGVKIKLNKTNKLEEF